MNPFALIPTFIIAFAIVVVVAVPFLMVWLPYRTARGRRRLCLMLEQGGYSIERMELRWLTRGPFNGTRLPDLSWRQQRPGGMGGKPRRAAGFRRGDWLYRVAVRSPEHRPTIAWIKWCPGWPWESDDRWELIWDDDTEARKGVSTPVYAVLTVAFMAVFLGFLLPHVLGEMVRLHRQNERPAAAAVSRHSSLR